MFLRVLFFLLWFSYEIISAFYLRCLKAEIRTVYFFENLFLDILYYCASVLENLSTIQSKKVRTGKVCDMFLGRYYAKRINSQSICILNPNNPHNYWPSFRFNPIFSSAESEFNERLPYISLFNKLWRLIKIYSVK